MDIVFLKGLQIDRIIPFVKSSDFLLAGTPGERMTGIIRLAFPVPRVRLAVNKKEAIRGMSDVCIQIERGSRIDHA